MKSSGSSKRATAGRSGGIFKISRNSAGIPSYQYQPGYGSGFMNSSFEVNADTIGLDKKEDEEIELSSYSKISLQETTSIDMTANRCDLDSNTRNAHVGATAFQQCHRKSTSSGTTIIFGSQNLSNGAHKLKNNASKFQRRLRGKWLKYRSGRDDKGESVSEYTLDLDGATDMYDGKDEPLDGKQAFRNPRSNDPGYFDPYIKPRLPEFEDMYFSTQEEYLRAEVNFQFFCSFPDKAENESTDSNGDNETKTRTQEEREITSSEVEPLITRDMRNHYEVLGVTSHCNNQLITSRARQMMSSLHPDRISCRTAEQKTIDAKEFARVSLAKTELLDTELRALHDQEIATAMWIGVPLS